MRRFFSTLFLPFFLFGCAVPESRVSINPIDTTEFNAMLPVLAPVLREKGVLDSQDTWYEPVFSFSTFGDAGNAGEILLQRLSPAFRFPQVEKSLIPHTFAALFGENAQVVVTKTGFEAKVGLDTAEAALVALTDWNKDGTEDWLVVCRVKPSSVAQAVREYYVVITDLTPQVLEPQVILVHDCLMGTCASGVQAPMSFSDTMALEVETGQTAVTAPPPASNAPKEQNPVPKSKLTQ